MEIGRTIKIERAKRKMTAKQLAEKAEISSSYLSEIENEKQYPSINMLNRISVALGITLEDLFIESTKK